MRLIKNVICLKLFQNINFIIVVEGVQDGGLLKVSSSFVEYEPQADLAVYIVNYESQAGWWSMLKKKLLDFKQS